MRTSRIFFTIFTMVFTINLFAVSISLKRPFMGTDEGECRKIPSIVINRISADKTEPNFGYLGHKSLFSSEEQEAYDALNIDVLHVPSDYIFVADESVKEDKSAEFLVGSSSKSVNSFGLVNINSEIIPYTVDLKYCLIWGSRMRVKKADFCELLTRNRFLETVYCKISYGFRDDSPVESSLPEALQGTQHLKELGMCCRDLYERSEEIIASLSVIAGLPELLHLHIRGLNIINAIGWRIIEIAERDFSDCDEDTEDGLFALTEKGYTVDDYKKSECMVALKALASAEGLLSLTLGDAEWNCICLRQLTEGVMQNKHLQELTFILGFDMFYSRMLYGAGVTPIETEEQATILQELIGADPKEIISPIMRHDGLRKLTIGCALCSADNLFVEPSNVLQELHFVFGAFTQAGMQSISRWLSNPLCSLRRLYFVNEEMDEDMPHKPFEGGDCFKDFRFGQLTHFAVDMSPILQGQDLKDLTDSIEKYGCQFEVLSLQNLGADDCFYRRSVESTGALSDDMKRLLETLNANNMDRGIEKTYVYLANRFDMKNVPIPEFSHVGVVMLPKEW